MIVVVLIKAEHVKLRLLGKIKSKADHIGEKRARTVVRRSVLENLLEPVKAHYILPADGKVKKPVEIALTLDKKVIEKNLVGESRRARLRADIPTELVGKARVDSKALLKLYFAPCADAVTHTVRILTVGSLTREPPSGKPGDIVENLLSNTQIGTRVEFNLSGCREGGQSRRSRN